ncbi:Probable NADH dehydrogenase [Geodia barretti]|uniref:Probable NADH dehydrogenase n=1 Tax=Geodia barretti TaxID=519541 RepID=A0AA35SBU2_GEOBA|nr:Probable NADH dehydrogenase [Geodia barretti]
METRRVAKRAPHYLRQLYSSLLGTRDGRRERLVILGTGWGSYSVLKKVDKKRFDAIVISPRNHFLFTPLLASTTVGTLEFRSIIEPVRNTGFRDEHHFHLSYASDLDTDRRVVHCTSSLDPNHQYEVPYDRLVIGVGADTNHFNIPGVLENAFFLKEIADARNIRNQIMVNFELATQHDAEPEERRRLLHFVVVGGGPTGVEFSAEFYDFLAQDLQRLFPDEKDTVRVTLVEANEILSAFDSRLRSYTERLISKRSAMNIVKAAVTSSLREKCRWRRTDKVRFWWTLTSEYWVTRPAECLLWETAHRWRDTLSLVPPRLQSDRDGT